MIRNLACSTVMGLVLLVGGLARADVPRVISFQGRLALKGGAPVTGNNFSIVFSIHTQATGGTACHSATHTVNINSGLFNVKIGEPAGINAACTFAAQSYLEIKVGTDSPMSPRIPLTASAYAFAAGRLVSPGTSTAYQAGNASGRVPLSNGTVNTSLNADLLDGKHGTDFAPAGHDHHDIAVYDCAGVPKLAYASGCVLRGYLKRP